MTTMTLDGAKSRLMVNGSKPSVHRAFFVSGAKGSAEEKTPTPYTSTSSVQCKNTACTKDREFWAGGRRCTRGVLAFSQTFVSLQN